MNKVESSTTVHDPGGTHNYRADMYWQMSIQPSPDGSSDGILQ
jgi:hypothetical protein